MLNNAEGFISEIDNAYKAERRLREAETFMVPSEFKASDSPIISPDWSTNGPGSNSKLLCSCFLYSTNDSFCICLAGLEEAMDHRG